MVMMVSLPPLDGGNFVTKLMLTRSPWEDRIVREESSPAIRLFEALMHRQVLHPRIHAVIDSVRGSQ